MNFCCWELLSSPVGSTLQNSDTSKSVSKLEKAATTTGQAQGRESVSTIVPHKKKTSGFIL
jgi:hypothetical protein